MFGLLASDDRSRPLHILHEIKVVLTECILIAFAELFASAMRLVSKPSSGRAGFMVTGTPQSAAYSMRVRHAMADTLTCLSGVCLSVQPQITLHRGVSAVLGAIGAVSCLAL
jgi:hypothetical protein